MTTTSPQPDGDRAARIEELAAQTLAAVRRLESALVGSAPGSAPVFVAAKTAATVALVAQRWRAGEDLSGVDDFWIEAAGREMLREEAGRERVLSDALAALAAKRFYPARAREVALAVLTASGHPAFTGLPASAVAGTADDEAAGQ
jgi:hypothetical protein